MQCRATVPISLPVAAGILQLRLPNAASRGSRQKATTNLVNEMFPLRLFFYLLLFRLLLFRLLLLSVCCEQFLVFGKCMAFYCAHCCRQRQRQRHTPCENASFPRQTEQQDSNCRRASYDCVARSLPFSNAFRIFIYYVYLLPFVCQGRQTAAATAPAAAATATATGRATE